jgi:hypothetical protein
MAVGYNLMCRWIGCVIIVQQFRARLAAMLQIVPQMKILIAIRVICVLALTVWPCCVGKSLGKITSAAFVFRNRRGNAVKILIYDGLGYWLCLHRFSRGRLRWWPTHTDVTDQSAVFSFVK